MDVHNEKVYDRILAQGHLGLAEAYMDGWWDCDQLDECCNKLLRARLYTDRNWHGVLPMLKAKILNLQSRRRSQKVIEKHYDLGNNLFAGMLDPRMIYTCGYWDNVDTLEQAQEAKMDLICRKIGLQKGQRVLDIGCGFGSFCKFASERYGAELVGITLSKEQANYAREMCKSLPIEIRVQDYRECSGEKFNHIVSIGMFEAVGYKNFHKYMQIVNSNLEDDGLFLLHTIGGNESTTHADPFITKYIFPNGMIPSIAQIGKSIENLFVMEECHNFGVSYAKTLRVWYENFEGHWHELREKYGQRFYRMWRYYLLSCAGAFEARDLQLWQIVLSKQGVLGGYQSVR